MKVEFHEWMLLFRLRRELSQDEMAAEAGISQGLLSMMEWGLRPVSEEVADWFDAAMAKSDFENSLSDGEKFRLMVRRKGWNMKLAGEHFGVSESRLLRWMRDEVDVPDWAWATAA